MKLGIFLSILLVLSGCTSMYPVQASNAKEYITSLSVGDKVNVKTIDAKDYRFTITQLDSQYMYGDNLRLAYKQISTVSKEKPSKAKTLTLMSTGFVVALVYLFAANWAAP